MIRLAPTRTSNPVDADPTRLFPELGFERVVAFLADRDGGSPPPRPADQDATLHGAADDEKLFGDGTAATLLLERLAPMLAALVENQRALEGSLRDLRRQVIQSEKLASLGQIAAGIVHELNNPLTTIVAYSDFLRRKLASRGDPADVERLARINEAAERILRFSRDLTAYSRPANEVPAPVAIHDVIERALVFCEHELDKTGVLIERSFGEVRPVRGVAGQLTQVFVNLFTNAAHAMRPHGGLLTIATSVTDAKDKDREVLVTITDDGHGIWTRGHLERIFEPFFTTKTDGSGTGLGLSIVRSIIQTHGGRISVAGKQPRGTVFLCTPSCPRRGAPRRGVTSEGFGGLRVPHRQSAGEPLRPDRLVLPVLVASGRVPLAHPLGEGSGRNSASENSPARRTTTPSRCPPRSEGAFASATIQRLELALAPHRAAEEHRHGRQPDVARLRGDHVPVPEDARHVVAGPEDQGVLREAIACSMEWTA